MNEEPVVRHYVFQLHHSAQPWGKRADEVDWAATAVGEPIRFTAVLFGRGAWYAKGPVIATASEDLADAGWTVFLEGEVEAPTIAGHVGRTLSEGDEFTLPITDVIVGGMSRD
jgi:hypothetical protein